MVVRDDVAGRIDDETRPQGHDLAPLAAGIGAGIGHAAVLEKSLQQIVERGGLVALIGRLVRRGGGIRAEPGRDADDRRQHLLDQRVETRQVDRWRLLHLRRDVFLTLRLRRVLPPVLSACRPRRGKQTQRDGCRDQRRPRQAGQIGKIQVLAKAHVSLP